MRDLAALGLDLLLRVLELLGGSLGLEGDLCIVSTIPSFSTPYTYVVCGRHLGILSCVWVVCE